MRRKGRAKYILVIFLLFFIIIYGLIKVNINKPELVRKKSKFTMQLTARPFDFKVETAGYIFYANGKIIDSMKEKCINAYNEIISK